MIICKRPVVLYDVDAAGVAALVLLGVVAYFAVFVPVQAQQKAVGALRSELGATRSATGQTGAHLRTLRQDVAQLQRCLADGAAQAPTATSLTQFLSRIAVLAEEANLQVLQIVPAPTQRVEDHLTSDVHISGRGRSLDFIRFLDRLARENPYQSLQRFSVTQEADAEQGVCTLSWTVRLNMLPPAPSASVEEKS